MTIRLLNNDYTQQPTLLRTKSQLNKIIIGKNNSPDHLAINIYWDTLRSWYNPNKTYTKDGNVLHVTKLKTKGVYLNYQKLSDLHGVSKDAIRKKIVKLEQLGLINRSFQHKETITTKSFNQLIVYVWKNTPHFFNALGIDQTEITNLNPYTSHNYVADKHNVVFVSQAIQNKTNLVQGGVLPQADTKELTNYFFKEKNRSIKSNFCKNSFEEDPIKKLPINNDNQENRAVNTAPIKNIFTKAKKLKDFYPLTKEDCSILQSSSGRDFSLNAMNEILLDMSKRLGDKFFYSKKGFLSYMSKAFTWEKRDAVKINNEGFRIRNNQNFQETTLKEQDEFLTKIENSLEISPQWHLRKKIAAVFESPKAYALLKAFGSVSRAGGLFNISFEKHIDLSEVDRELLMDQIKATHESRTLGFIEKIEIIMPEKAQVTRNYNNKEQPEPTKLPENIWGRIRQKLISIYGEAIDRNWFSKLGAGIDEESRVVQLQAPSEFIKDWVSSNYLESIKEVGLKSGYRIWVY